MFSVFKDRPRILLEAQKARFQPKFILQLLIFVAVFFVTTIAEAVPYIIYLIFSTMGAAARGELALSDPYALMNHMNEMDGIVLISLFSTLLMTLLVIVYCRAIEKRSLYSMGFVRDKAFKDYAIGLAAGFLMFAVSVLIAWASGTLQYKGFVLGNGYILLFGFFIGFVLQGMSEEVLLRGYFMISVANRKSILFAVLANSLFFAMLHLANGGVTVLAIVNLVLFGLFTSIYTLKMNSIWGVCAIHSIWNFAQGNIFGILVSGIDAEVSVFAFEPTATGSLVNGGAFGLEGGIAVTIVLLLSTFVALKLKGREIVRPEEEENHDSQTILPA